MVTADWLPAFYATIEDDSRISVTHVSLYIAICHTWISQKCSVYMEIDRKRIMTMAKISSPVTYSKCMHALHDFGYLQYVPFSGRRKSIVKLRKL